MGNFHGKAENLGSDSESPIDTQGKRPHESYTEVLKIQDGLKECLMCSVYLLYLLKSVCHV